jgi:hypothetical protein
LLYVRKLVLLLFEEAILGLFCFAAAICNERSANNPGNRDNNIIVTNDSADKLILDMISRIVCYYITVSVFTDREL